MLDTDDVHCLQSISAGQYQAIAQVSKATATGHLADLIEKNRFEKISAGGRSTRYRLSLDQILIPCAIRSLAARKPSILL
ncbi:hypothetical protein ACV1C9_23155, partial [Aeromonas caviae]